MRFYTFILLFLSAIVSSQLTISYSNKLEHSQATVQFARSQNHSPGSTGRPTGTGRREIMAFTPSDCC